MENIRVIGAEMCRFCHRDIKKCISFNTKRRRLKAIKQYYFIKSSTYSMPENYCQMTEIVNLKVLLKQIRIFLISKEYKSIYYLTESILSGRSYKSGKPVLEGDTDRFIEIVTLLLSKIK